MGYVKKKSCIRIFRVRPPPISVAQKKLRAQEKNLRLRTSLHKIAVSFENEHRYSFFPEATTNAYRSLHQGLIRYRNRLDIECTIESCLILIQLIDSEEETSQNFFGTLKNPPLSREPSVDSASLSSSSNDDDNEEEETKVDISDRTEAGEQKVSQACLDGLFFKAASIPFNCLMAGVQSRCCVMWISWLLSDYADFFLFIGVHAIGLKAISWNLQDRIWIFREGNDCVEGFSELEQLQKIKAQQKQIFSWFSTTRLEKFNLFSNHMNRMDFSSLVLVNDGETFFCSVLSNWSFLSTLQLWTQSLPSRKIQILVF